MQYIDVLSLTETKLDDTLGSSQPNKSSFSSTIKFQKKKKKKKKKDEHTTSKKYLIFLERRDFKVKYMQFSNLLFLLFLHSMRNKKNTYPMSLRSNRNLVLELRCILAFLQGISVRQVTLETLLCCCLQNIISSQHWTRVLLGLLDNAFILHLRLFCRRN